MEEILSVDGEENRAVILGGRKLICKLYIESQFLPHREQTVHYKD